MNIEEKEKIEIEFWKNARHENPSEFSVHSFLSKTLQLQTFHKKIHKRIQFIRNSKNVLELGSGQGWASCFLKKWFLPHSKFTVTDISPYAIASVKYWEEIYDIKIDETHACKSYQLPFDDNSFDLIFCYAAAHHFVKIEETLNEVKRVLKKNGSCIFFYEPTSSKLFYKLHMKYVNSLDPSTPEDVLIPAEMEKIANRVGLTYYHFYDVESQHIRSLFLGFYFKFISTFGFLKRILPSSSDFVFVNED